MAQQPVASFAILSDREERRGEEREEEEKRGGEGKPQKGRGEDAKETPLLLDP